jgi:hypothetical protein
MILYMLGVSVFYIDFSIAARLEDLGDPHLPP